VEFVKRFHHFTQFQVSPLPPHTEKNEIYRTSVSRLQKHLGIDEVELRLENLGIKKTRDESLKLSDLSTKQ
jgi:hypothetical protein